MKAKVSLTPTLTRSEEDQQKLDLIYPRIKSLLISALALDICAVWEMPLPLLMKSERAIDGTTARCGMGFQLAPDITGNRQHNYFLHERSPLFNQCKNQAIRLKSVPPGG